MRTGKKAKGNTTKAAKRNAKTGGNATSSSATTAKKSGSTVKTAVTAPTHEQIAQRAEHLWRQGGCLPGRDEQNWREAEAQLKAEAAAQ